MVQPQVAVALDWNPAPASQKARRTSLPALPQVDPRLHQPRRDPAPAGKDGEVRSGALLAAGSGRPSKSAHGRRKGRPSPRELQVSLWRPATEKERMLAPTERPNILHSAPKACNKPSPATWQPQLASPLIVVCCFCRQRQRPLCHSLSAQSGHGLRPWPATGPGGSMTRSLPVSPFSAAATTTRRRLWCSRGPWPSPRTPVHPGPRCSRAIPPSASPDEMFPLTPY
jgi:hypothetical protein